MAASASIVNRPDLVSPVIGGLFYRLDSASASITDFKYVVDLYQYTDSGTGTKLGRFKFPPRPDNYGVFDASKSLRGRMGFAARPFSPSIVRPTDVSDSSISPACIYTINPGVEYYYGAVFADTNFGAYTGGYTLGYTFSSPHGLLVGDVITIDKDNKQLNLQYDGTCSVVQVVDSWKIGVDKMFGDSSTNEGGVVSYLLRMSSSIDNKLNTFNGTRQYDEAGQNFLYAYVVGTNSSAVPYVGQTRALTTYGNVTDEYRRVKTDDYECLSVLTGTSSDKFTYERIRKYNSSNTLLGTYFISNSVSTNHISRLDCPSGPANLLAGGIDVTDSSYYYIDFVEGATSSPSQVSYNYKYIIESANCNYTNYRIMFMNQLGGTDFYNFKLDSKNTYNTQKTEFKKTLDWNYSMSQNGSPRGRTTLSQKTTHQVTITTDWITEKESIWLRELINSPEVFVLRPVNDFQYIGLNIYTNNYIPIIITETSYQVKTYLRDKLFNLQITFEYANNIRVQNQ